MNLLVVNLHSSQNAGDHALTIQTIRQLAAAFEGATITLALNDPDSQPHEDATNVGSFATWVRRGAGWRLDGFLPLLLALLWALLWRATGRDLALGLRDKQRHLLRAYAEADAIFSCAGHVFTSGSGIGVSMMLTLFTLGYGALFGTPLFTMPQSFGPWRNGLSRWLFRLLAGRITLLLAREPLAAAALANLGVPAARVRLVPDLALAYDGSDVAEAARLLAELEAEALGVTVINWGAQHRRFDEQGAYESAVAGALRRFRQQAQAPVYLFAQVWGPTEAEDDRIPARRIAAALDDAGVTVVDEALDPATLRSCYGRMALLLGTRMHANIFALSAGTPVVAIGYRDKTRGIMQMAGLEEWVLDIEGISEEALAERLLSAWRQRTELRKRIAGTLPTLITEAAGAGELLARAWRKARG